MEPLTVLGSGVYVQPPRWRLYVRLPVVNWDRPYVLFDPRSRQLRQWFPLIISAVNVGDQDATFHWVATYDREQDHSRYRRDSIAWLHGRGEL